MDKCLKTQSLKEGDFDDEGDLFFFVEALLLQLKLEDLCKMRKKGKENEEDTRENREGMD